MRLRPATTLSPRLWAALVLLSAVFVNVNVSVLVVAWQRWAGIARAASASAPLEPRWLITTAGITQLALLMLALFWVWLVGRAEALPHRRVPPSAWLGAFLLTLGALPLGSALELLVARWVGQPTTTGLLVAEVARRSSALELAALYGAIAILPGIAEELLFRGVTLRLLLERSRAEALLISSLYFALAHLEPAQAAGTLVLGLAFGFARIATGSVLPAVVAHALNNALVLTVAVLLPEEAFSDQELSLPALLVGTAMAALGARVLTHPGSRP